MAIHGGHINQKGMCPLITPIIYIVLHSSIRIFVVNFQVRSEDGALFLDMKVGNLMQQRVIRVQTEQAHEISRLVRQYITMAQSGQRDRRD